VRELWEVCDVCSMATEDVVAGAAAARAKEFALEVLMATGSAVTGADADC